MDHQQLKSQADRMGRDIFDLLAEYRKNGVNAVAVYEDTLGNWQNRGHVIVQAGADLRALHPNGPFLPGKYYVRETAAGKLDALKGRFSIASTPLQHDGVQWQEWNINPSFLPVGPDTELIAELQRQGYGVMYRPYDDPSVLHPAADWPEVPWVAFNGTEVVGARDPERLEKVIEKMSGAAILPALIEGTPQRGLPKIMEDTGGLAARMFSINAVWQERLLPLETASKYALAARERGHRLLYVRPYPTVTETNEFLSRLSFLLNKAGVAVGMPEVHKYAPSATLQLLAAAGPLLALLLIGLSYPLPRLGLLVAVGVLGGAFAINGLSPWPSLALVASVVFPALGFVLWRSKITHWFAATLLSAFGVLFVSAFGASGESMLGLEPFHGVGLTLLLPMLLVLGSYLPAQDLRKTAAQIWNRPLGMGDLIVMGAALVAFAVMFMRRGNVSAVGVSDAEARMRQELQDSIIRPRFKEVLGHPLALLGLGGGLPAYFPGLLLLGGVMGQASILNTFAHFHTPLAISATRMVIGLLFGLLFGLVALPMWRGARFIWQHWQGKGEQA